MTSDLKVDSSIDFFVIKIIDMFLEFRDFIAEAKEKMQCHQMLLNLMTINL